MTTLIEHPTADFNTFASRANATLYADDSLDHALWTALSDEDKDRWLLGTFQYMSTLPEFVPPNIADTCLGKTQVAIILNDLKYGISSVDIDQQTRTEKFGTLMKENFKNEFADRLTPPRIPDEVWPCLVNYGVTQVDNTSGVSTIRRTR